jgi:DEAD/DEAH box helicase domain-containing protein
MVKHPEYFFGRAPEKGFVDPNNMYIMLDHLKCAAFEVPFGVDHHFPETAPTYMDYLEEQGVVRRTGGKYYWSDRSYPAEEISLRSATADNVVIVDTTGGRHEVIGETDRPAAKETLFDNAIYIHRGNQFVVTQLDLDNRRAYVEATDVKYYTDAIVKRDIKVLHEDLRETVDGSLCVTGDILVRSQVSRFKKIRYRTHENVGFGEISLPEEQMHTRSVAIVFAEGTPAGEVARELPAEMIGPVIARIGTLFKNVAGVFLLCDAGDIGVAERYKDPHFDAPCLYIYDAYPGGSGMADSFLRSLHQVLSAASDLVGSCSCSEGCPSCVGPRDPSEEIDANPKTAAKLFLSRWLAGLVKSA